MRKIPEKVNVQKPVTEQTFRSCSLMRTYNHDRSARAFTCKKKKSFASDLCIQRLGRKIRPRGDAKKTRETKHTKAPSSANHQPCGWSPDRNANIKSSIHLHGERTRSKPSMNPTPLKMKIRPRGDAKRPRKEKRTETVSRSNHHLNK